MMKRLRIVFLSIFFVAASLSHRVHASQDESGLCLETNKIENKIESFFSSHKVPKDRLGIWIKYDQRPAYSFNGERSMIPASLSKLVTGATVLENLPTGHHFVTELYTKGSVQSGILEGNLYLKGGGDPSFVSEDMWFLVNEFRRTGIQQINGKIIVDSSRFDEETFSETRQEQRVDRAYDAPVGAMSFNWNSVNVFIRPGSKAGEPARVFIDPVSDYIELVNKTKTVSSGATNVSVVRGGKSDVGGDRIEVRGTIRVGDSEKVFYKNISRPAIWSAYNLKEFLSQRGVKVTGSVETGKLPSGADKVAEFKSKSLSLIVADMMKFSNNYVSEMLIKNLAAEVKGTPGTINKGMPIVLETLKSWGLKDFTFTNPAGLNRENHLSPKQLSDLLVKAKQHFRWAPEFTSSLPIAGIDGTLKNRMKDISEQIRAKTGLLEGVLGLGGYGMSRSGVPFHFVFIYNGPEDFTRVKNLFDGLGKNLVSETWLQSLPDSSADTNRWALNETCAGGRK